MQIHITQDDPKNIFIERYYDISPFSRAIWTGKIALNGML